MLQSQYLYYPHFTAEGREAQILKGRPTVLQLVSGEGGMQTRKPDLLSCVHNHSDRASQQRRATPLAFAEGVCQKRAGAQLTKPGQEQQPRLCPPRGQHASASLCSLGRLSPAAAGTCVP